MSTSALAGSIKTGTVILYHDAQLNGPTIPAGEYTVKCETKGTTAQVKFMQGRKEVASANGQTKDLGQKTAQTKIMFVDGNGAHSIQEVDLGGSTTGVTFDSSMANADK
jgi:hypothetical protein